MYTLSMAKESLSVFELTEKIKDLLEEGFPGVCVEGEVSNFKAASSGHLYFTLKDERASLQAVMFRGKAQGLGFEPRDGQRLIARGAITVYPARGNYQLVCDSLAPVGQGDILAMLEERKRRLAQEGLFSEDRKRPIPNFPERVVVITSPSGAAIRDILSVLKRRNSAIHVVILPAAVQGQDAAAELSSMIGIANRFQLGDVLIIGRGGGSIEDLLAFSDENLVRAVANSQIPVISAVGHEIDWSLCDLAADLRAPTPSAAAEIVSERSDQIIRFCSEAVNRLSEEVRARLNVATRLLGHFSGQELEYSFRSSLQPLLQRFDDLKESLFQAIALRIERTGSRLASICSDLENLSPSSVLARGYVMVSKVSSGQMVRSVRDITTGDGLELRFYDGSRHAAVQEEK